TGSTRAAEPSLADTAEMLIPVEAPAVMAASASASASANGAAAVSKVVELSATAPLATPISEAPPQSIPAPEAATPAPAAAACAAAQPALDAGLWTGKVDRPVSEVTRLTVESPTAPPIASPITSKKPSSATVTSEKSDVPAPPSAPQAPANPAIQKTP